MTRIIRKELVPAWGQRDPNSIQRAEIQLWAKAIADGKGRKKPAPYLANRAVDYMAMIYSWAVRREILVFPGPNGKPLNWVHKASSKVLDAAGIEDGRHRLLILLGEEHHEFP